MAGEWATARLGELCDFRAGSVFKPALQGRSNGEYPFVKVSDMNLPANAVRIQDANNWVSAADLRELRAKPFPPGTVVFAKIGEALRHNRLRQVARETVVDNNMMGAVPRTDRIEPRFFYYALSRFDFSDIAQGTALPYLTVGSLSMLTLDVPPLAEQRAIAHILGTLDDKIELNRRMSETLEAMARALFKSWFVDFDPVRAKMEGRWQRGQSLPGLPAHLYDLFPDRLVPSELGEIPEGWEVGSVYEVADVIYGAPFSSARFNSDKVGDPLIRIRDLPGEAPGVWTPEVHPKGYKVCPGDIVVGMDGEFRAHLWGGAEGWLNQRVCVFKPKPLSSAVFVRNAIIPLLADVEATETATTVIHLGKADIDRFRLVLPSPSVAGSFNTVCQPWYDRIVAAKQETRTLAALRDALLPKLISGELRVKDAERFLKERGL